MWTPVLMPARPPLGMVFACFMVAIMIGSSLYALLLSKGYRAEDTLKIILLILLASMILCCFAASPDRSYYDLLALYAGFLALEIAIGMYFPAMSYLRSQIIPEGHRANVMNWFRVPMNIITCSVLLCLNLEFFAKDQRIMFGICLVLCVLGLVAWTRFKKVMDKISPSHHIVDLSNAGDHDHSEKANLLSNNDSDA